MYGDADTTVKAARTVGGRKLTYRPTAPVPGSFRARAPQMARTGGYSFASVGGRELNFKDTTLGSISFDNAPTLTLINGLAQGTTASTRIGRRVNVRSIQWRFNCSGSTTTSWTSNRYWIVMDMQSNAAAPQFTDIFDTADPSTLRNISNMQRFKVLFDSDEFIIAGNLAAPNNSMLACAHKGYLKVNLPVQYNAGSAGTIGDIQTGSIYFITVGNSSSGTTNTDVFNSAIRIRYSDN